MPLHDDKRELADLLLEGTGTASTLGLDELTGLLTSVDADPSAAKRAQPRSTVSL